MDLLTHSKSYLASALDLILSDILYNLQERNNTTKKGNSRAIINPDPQVVQGAAEADLQLHLAEALDQELEPLEGQFRMKELVQTQDQIPEEAKKIVSSMEDVVKNSIVR